MRITKEKKELLLMRLRGRLVLSIFIFILFGICVSDEYILPKIAERDLRRFANLHSTSSKLGLRLPLDKMPVKCPVSGIIKQRKIQGQDCLERNYNVSLPHNKIPDALCELAKKMAAPAMPGGEEFRPEAAIVNYFGLGDTLGGHLDDMELIRKPHNILVVSKYY
ncbi:hypothetical protein ACSBR2_023083 [Camellia fascicularis]